jgi:hypothetical protein
LEERSDNAAWQVQVGTFRADDGSATFADNLLARPR